MSKLQIHYLFIVMIVYDNTITKVSGTAVGLCFCQLMTKISSFDVGWRICNLKTCVNSKFACFWIDYTEVNINDLMLKFTDSNRGILECVPAKIVIHICRLIKKIICNF